MPDVGDLVASTNGGWVLWAPLHCHAGHPLRPGRMIVGHRPCSCGGHTVWACPMTCGADVFHPPLEPDCTVLTGPRAEPGADR